MIDRFNLKRIYLYGRGIVEGIPTEVVPEIEDKNQDQGDGTTKKSKFHRFLVCIPVSALSCLPHKSYFPVWCCPKLAEAKKPVKLLRKIPPKVLSEAVGLAIFTNFVSWRFPYTLVPCLFHGGRCLGEIMFGTVIDLDISFVMFHREPLSHLSEVAEEPESSSPDYPMDVSLS
jgi:hypothetical protein